ncbi:hypothetical protein ACFOKI_06665 [Sphingomonas qilianensis]|uniref:Uncharacterized protein n=1 Tax=Sphingomonas qilianensis TaxID=1736690 RepID=A0ABU9XTH2_9SPHN
MTRSLNRIRRLEERAGATDKHQQQIADDAQTFLARMTTLAGNFADGDHAVDDAIRAEWSPAQNVAWAIRFAPNRVSIILQEHA